MVLLARMGIGQTLNNERLDYLIAKTISKHNIPSMVVAVVKPDTIWYGIQGNTRVDTNKKVQLTDKYHIGSNTKAFTSFLAFQAIEDHKISIDTKFLDLYPNFKAVRSEYKEITLSDLLSHNARLRPYTNGKEFQELPELNGSISDKRYEFAQHILNQKPVGKGVYSNAGYVLAAMMLEKVYHLPFESILKNAMDEMGLEVFFGFPNKQDINYPWGHLMEHKKQVSLSPKHEYKLEDYMLPAGDLSINILDYATFIKKHLNGVLGNDSTLKKESYEKLFYGLASYSYGWGNKINRQGKIAFHDGSAGTFYSSTLISSTHEFAIIIIMNCADHKQVKQLYKLRKKLFRSAKSYAS